MQLQSNILCKLWALFCMIAFVTLLDMGVSFSQESTAKGVETIPASGNKAGEKSVASKTTSTDLYAAEPEPLTVTQCGQCHTGIYRNLKNDGGRHKFACQNCHRNIHSYNPVKTNWLELMPKCSDCHTTPHGAKFTDCSACHMNPHAAGIVTVTKIMLNACPECHSNPFEQLQKSPSAHSKLSCTICHKTHGFIPNCNACHKPHFETQAASSCTTECHPAHTPRVIIYKKDTDARTCNACHGNVYSRWIRSPSRHAKVNCAACHTKHGYIPVCSECHQATHSKELLAKYPNCLTCHQDVHDLPVKQRSK